MSGLGHIMRTCFNLLVSYLASVSEERQLICAWNDCSCISTPSPTVDMYM